MTEQEAPGRAERAPPRRRRGEQSNPKEVAPGVLWAPGTPKPVMLPPERSLLAYILSDKDVWRRFMISMVVVPLLWVGALKFLGVDIAIVGITSTATMLGVVMSAYLGRRRDVKQSHSAPETDATSSGEAPSSGATQGEGSS